MMKKLFVVFLFVIAVSQCFAQQTETDALKQAVNTLFDGMRKGDSAMLAAVFHKDMVLQTAANKKDGSVVLMTEKATDFLKSVGTPHKEKWDERITFGDIKIDGVLASVWTPYKFYVDDKFSHCGVNFFQLMKTSTGWKIIYIVDTRRRDNCPE